MLRVLGSVTRMDGLLPPGGHRAVGDDGDIDKIPLRFKGSLLILSHDSSLSVEKVENLLFKLLFFSSLDLLQSEAGQELKSIDFLLFLNHREMKEKQFESTIVISSD